MDFFDTQAGYNFTQYVIPSLIDSIDRLNNNLERFMEKQEQLSVSNEEMVKKKQEAFSLQTQTLRENLEKIGVLGKFEGRPYEIIRDFYFELDESYKDFLHFQITEDKWNEKSGKTIMNCEETWKGKKYTFPIKADDVISFYKNPFLDFHKITAEQILNDMCNAKDYIENTFIEKKDWNKEMEESLEDMETEEDMEIEDR